MLLSTTKDAHPADTLVYGPGVARGRSSSLGGGGADYAAVRRPPPLPPGRSLAVAIRALDSRAWRSKLPSDASCRRAAPCARDSAVRPAHASPSHSGRCGARRARAAGAGSVRLFAAAARRRRARGWHAASARERRRAVERVAGAAARRSPRRARAPRCAPPRGRLVRRRAVRPLLGWAGGAAAAKWASHSRATARAIWLPSCAAAQCDARRTTVGAARRRAPGVSSPASCSPAQG